MKWWRVVLGRPLDGGPYPYVWLAFLRSLTARGLSGVELVTSDAHQSLPLRKQGG